MYVMTELKALIYVLGIHNVTSVLPSYAEQYCLAQHFTVDEE